MLTVPEAARRAGRNPETIRRWIREGKLRARKVGTQHVLEEADLAAMLEERSDAVPLPEHWKRGFWGGPMPDWAAIVREQRSEASEDDELTDSLRDGGPTRHITARVQESAIAYLPRTWERGGPSRAELLARIVGRIVHALDPARIILFGSEARGEARVDSDFDLLVILDSVDHRREARIAARRSFDDLPVAADVLVASTAEANGEVVGRPVGAVAWAIETGRLVYERGRAS